MADQPLLLALDQGTSSSRAAVFDAQGELVASATAPLPIQYPADGWVEQHPSDIWDSQEQALIGLHQQLNDDQRRSVVTREWTCRAPLPSVRRSSARDSSSVDTGHRS